MKLTEGKLKRIIQEEMEKLQNEDLASNAGKAYGLVDAALGQAERWANELSGIEDYIQDPEVKGIAEQSIMELNGALKEVSASLQKLIAAVDDELSKETGGASEEDFITLRDPNV